jgi:hypothetical protein
LCTMQCCCWGCTHAALCSALCWVSPGLFEADALHVGRVGAPVATATQCAVNDVHVIRCTCHCVLLHAQAHARPHAKVDAKACQEQSGRRCRALAVACIHADLYLPRRMCSWYPCGVV